ncbi:hypothetical protein RRG08_027666 [Elysia crispata]|uniref:RBR-type E3 ubiquitin transferase n=1 Tax=Elysia crispata TaxID=231223 RepID=A0AAE1CIU5_9GAST|nr:hypothetical protein RRG08_027666 [Elysia crispata]
MVLKKSNSSLNSGATQRVSRGGFLNPHKHDSQQRTSDVVEVGVEFVSADTTEHVRACLDKINDYLGFSGPNFADITNKKVQRQYRFQWNSESPISLSRGGNWNLRQRVHTLMQDIQFLKEVSRFIDINVTTTYHNVKASRTTGRTKTTTSSQILKNVESEEKEREKAKAVRDGVKLRMRQTYHGRGVQRRIRPNDESDEDDDAPNDNANIPVGPPKSSLTFTFYELCAADARASKLCERRSSRAEERYERNLFEKYKRSLHGVDLPGGFSVEEEAEELQDGLEAAELDSGENFSKPHGTFNLADFIPRSGKRALKRKHISTKNKRGVFSEKEEEEEAISCDRPYHSKGSYIFINDGSNTNHSTAHSSHVVPNDTGSPDKPVEFEIEDFSSSNNGMKEGEEVSHSGSNFLEDPQRIREKDFESFTDSFIPLQVLLLKDEISLCSGGSENLELENRPSITTGESLPHCFCIRSPNHLKEEYVVARQTSRDGKTWLLSIQGFSESQNQSLRVKLSGLSQTEKQSSMVEVIKVCEEILDEDAVSEELTPKCRSRKKDEHFKLHVWGELASKTRQEVNFHIAEEAAKKISLTSKQCHTAGAVTKLIKRPLDTSESMECGVCYSPCKIYTENIKESAIMLTPCGHAHCVSCWREHAYHSINSGAPRISCMTSGCDESLDETTIKTLVPVTLVASWQARLRDRLLQSSKYTSWCPDGRCGHVAMSSGAPLKKQFGSPLICNCLRSWCSNCQEDPHWPVSCDQISVYKKLLSKTGSETDVPATHASLIVDVKKCPNCNYPIEKFHGCPHMICFLCEYHFCWICLESTDTHNEYYCEDAEPNNSHMHSIPLDNKLIYDLPINFFMESLRANKQCALLCEEYSWFEKLRSSISYSRFLLNRRQPIKQLVCSKDVDLNPSLDLVEETLAFLRGALTQIELFYVLLGFVQLNKTKPTDRMVAVAKHRISKLYFVVDRLSTLVVGRSLEHVFGIQEQVLVLLTKGGSTLDELFALAPTLQQASEDVETAWVGDIDPSKHLRYM